MLKGEKALGFLLEKTTDEKVRKLLALYLSRLEQITYEKVRKLLALYLSITLMKWLESSWLFT